MTIRPQLMVSAHHMVENLASGLYESTGQRLMELIRNGLVASMDTEKWEPKKASIEILLVPHHPLGTKDESTLVVLDHGCGLTATALNRYFTWLGTPISELRRQGNVTYGGASQKGIGRLAALALNRNCVQEDLWERIKHGYYLLSRTSDEGRVRYVTVIPEEMEQNRGFEIDTFISANATEMGPLKNIKGTFTAIIIPTPIFSSNEEIYEAIKWLLPRELDKMFSLMIGGETVVPPPILDQVSCTAKNDPNIRARLQRGTDDVHGVWLCDTETGFRVASCERLGKAVPAPLWEPVLAGDIFFPGLLEHQNTARSTLAKEFMSRKNKQWLRLQSFLIGQVAPLANTLIDRDAISTDAAKTLDEIASLFDNIYGNPDDDVAITGIGGRGPDTKPRKTPEKRDDKDVKYRRHMTIKVRDETYVLYRQLSLSPFVFAEVNPNNPRHINVNVRGGYRALPKEKRAQGEHVLMQLLSAVGRSKFPDDPQQAMEFTNEVRSELFGKRP